MQSQAAERWDVFCRVVDNFGDVAVSWRLARLLAREHGKAVRLWLDDLTVLAKLRPEIDPELECQELEGVEIVRLREPLASIEVADVVVETFGCDPPEAYVQAMAGRATKPRWINLEYLSAEDWVEGSHALPSPHPRLPLTKHYFFPGFTPRTGGLLRERSLIGRRDEFQADAGAQAAFWHSLLGKAPPENALKVSLFTYAGAPLESLARTVQQHPGQVWLVACEGVATAALHAFVNAPHQRGIEVVAIPFVAQDRYDQILWACDLNFVRGEDSFVRAQWAARPFVWQIYPTEDGAHYVKMAAFLARYTEGLDRAQAAAVAGLWEAWNRPPGGQHEGAAAPSLADAWAAFNARMPALRDHAAAWGRRLEAQNELAAQLVDFADNVVQ